MARYRFPGRPGHKIGRSGALFSSEEARNFQDPTSIYASSILRGLKRFRELVGDSDEEEEFIGFSAEEVGIKAYRQTTKGVKQRDGEKIPSLPLSSETLKRGSCMTTRLSHARLSLEALPASERTRGRLKTLIRKSYKDLKKDESNEFRTTTHIIKRVKEIEDHVVIRSPPKRKGKTKLIVPSPIKSVPVKSKISVSPLRSSPVQSKYPLIKKVKRLQEGQLNQPLAPKLKKLKIRLVSDGKEAKIVRGRGRPSIYEKNILRKDQKKPATSVETEQQAVKGTKEKVAKRVRVVPATKKVDTNVVKQILQKAKRGRPRKYPNPISPSVSPKVKSHKDRTDTSSSLAKTTNQVSKTQPTSFKTSKSLKTQPALSKLSKTQLAESAKLKKAQTKLPKVIKSAKMSVKSQTVLPKEEKVVKNNEKTNSRRVKTLKDDTVTMATPVTSKGKPKLDMATPVTGKGKPKLEKPGGHPDVKSEPVNNLISPTSQISNTETPATKANTFKGVRRQFVLPTVSARSSRVIKPSKRFLDDDSSPIISAKLQKVDTTPSVTEALNQTVDAVTTSASSSDRDRNQYLQTESKSSLQPCDSHGPLKDGKARSRQTYRKPLLVAASRRKEKSPEKKKTEEIAAKLTKKAKQGMAKKSSEMAKMPQSMARSVKSKKDTKTGIVEKEVKQEMLSDVMNEGTTVDTNETESPPLDSTSVKGETTDVSKSEGSQVVTPERRSKRKVLLKQSVARLLGRDRKQKKDTHHSSNASAESSSATSAMQNAGSGAATSASSACKKDGKKVAQARRPSELVKKAKLQLQKAALNKTVKKAENVKKEQLAKLNTQLEMEQKRVHSPVDLKSFPVVSLESLTSMENCDNATHAARHEELPKMLQTANMSQPDVKENKTSKASDDEADTSDDVSTTSSNSTRGPRIKHVCRRAAVVLGQQRAMFEDDNHELRLSALPEREKEKLREKKEEKPIGSDDETPQLSPKKESKTTPKEDSPVKRRKVPMYRKRRRRCGQCEGCLRVDDCRKCEYCLDKVKYGGPNIKRQCCIHKKCKEPLPALEAPDVAPKAPRPKRERVPPSKLQKKKKEERPSQNSTAVPGSSVAVRPKTTPVVTDGKLIKIEYKQEDYEVESIWDYGMPIISTMPLVTRTVCFLCASTGKHELVYCNVCCEPFHEFCLEDDEKPLEGHADTWCCRRCKFCQVCGRQQNLLQCDKCHNTYHAECLGPNYPTKPTKRKKVWICTKCVRCKSCGATTPGQSFNAQWSHDFSLCQDCGKLFDKGNYCPLCQQCYTDDDYESKMMQCASCESWVHSKCEGLTDEMYQIMCELPEDIHYTCSKCKPEKPAQWQIDIKEEMQAGFQLVLGQLLATKSIEQLFKRKEKKEEPKESTKTEKVEKDRAVESVQTKATSLEQIPQAEQPMEVECGEEQGQHANEVRSESTNQDQAGQEPTNQIQCSESATQGEDTKEMKPTQESCADVEMTNQEQACSQDDVPNTETNTDGNKETVTQFDTFHKLDSPFPEHDNKSSESTDSAISETPEVTSKLEKSDESAGQLVCRRDLTIGRTCVIGPPRKHHAVDLFDMRDRMNEGKYTSVSAFSDDIVKIIQESISSEKDENASLKRGNRVAKSVFIKQMEKVFPWFNVHSSSFWEHNKNLPDGMLPNAVLPPHPDHEYAQWREKYSTEPTTPQPSPLKKIPPTPNKFFASDDGVFDLPMDSVGEDTRRCCLCGHFGDDEPNDAGRLLYCGQDEWIHINCALWSAEVFEEVDGSLINVHPAITRGRQMRCEHCNRFGATVGCCMRGCPANFHFMCARTEHAVFQEDKKVFCDAHHNKVDHELVEGDNFSVLRRVCVNMEGMKLKKELLKGWDPNSINVLTGAMTVEYLGSLSSLSDTKAALFPIDFKVTRVYWSTVDTRRRCIYTITIKEYKPCKPVTQIQDMNRTVVHNITLPSGIDDINYTIPHESETSPMEETSGDLDGGNMATDDVTGIVQMPVNVELESDGQGQGAVVMEVDDAVALATEYLTQADDEVSEILARQNQLPCETDPEFTQSTNTEVTERSQETQASSIASVGGLAPSTLKMLPPARLKSLTSKPVMDLTASPDYTASPRRLSIIAERLNAGAVGAKCAKEIKFPESVRDNYAAAENTAHNKSSEISENEQSSLVSSPDVLQTVDRTEFLENSEEQDTSSDNLEGNDESGLVLDIADSDLQLSDSALELMALNSDNLSVSNSIPAASSTTTSASNSMAAIDENSAQQIAQIEQELEEVGKTVMQCSGKYSGSIAETVGANLTNEEVNALVQKAITSVTATSECEMDISGNDDEESDVLAASSDRQLDSVTTYGISDERRQTALKFITSPVNNYSTSAGNQTEQDTEHSNASCDAEFVSDSNELGTVERESEISVSAATDCTTDHIADSVTDPSTDHSADSVTDYSTNHTSDSVTDKSESSVQDLSNTSADVPSSERTSLEEADSNAAGQHSTIRNQQSLLMVAPHTTTSTDAMKTDRKEKFLEEVESSVQGGKLSVEDESIEKDPKEEESVQVAPSYERSPDIETEKSKSETMATHLSDGEEQGEAERQTEANRRQRNNSEESENEVNERRTFLEGNSADAVAEEASRDEEQVGVDDEHSEEVQNLLFLCQYCGKGYKSKGPFTKHQRVCEEVRCDDQDDQFEKDLDIIDVSVHGRKRYPMRSTKTRLLRIVDYGTPTLPKPNKSPGKEEMVSPTQRRGRKKSLGSAESIIEEETMSPVRENERSDEGQDEE
ncbi:histone-lysine N-methyltransferase 2A-like isoform X1 [Ptychodera flava]|uniref:histone-lysine N-methyltransferase 2A-like isoform X1 n=2 Tax=Ptychodera flava TaxID=63121 RepID=UPI00396A31BA